jgi:hypothetical protein
MAHKLGVKGSDVLTSTRSMLLDLSVMLNRGLPQAEIQNALRQIFTYGTNEEKVDAFILTFQTRDIRGGKGERDLFTHMFNELFLISTKAATATLPLIPEYGCWRDVFNMIRQQPHEAHMELVTSQLKKDATKLLSSEMPSLAAKWAPREHNKKDKPLTALLATRLFPGQPNRNQLYRQTVAQLNKRLNTTEIDMCAKRFSQIDPAKVPGRCLKVHTKAFLNEVTKQRTAPSTDPDRVEAAERFIEHFSKAKQGSAKVNGADTVYPYELVEKALKHLIDVANPTIWLTEEGRRLSHSEAYYYELQQPGYLFPNCKQVPNPNFLSEAALDALEAQWQAIVEPIKTQGALSRTIAFADFSGSMESNNGIPLHNSMALALIIAECSVGTFKDHVLTFDSTPTLHKFKSTGLVNRLAEIRHMAQGTSTDFQAAYNLLLATMKESGCKPGTEPKDIIVLTDMGWDQAQGFSECYKRNQAVKTKPVESHPQIARRAFKLAGEQLFGSDNPSWQAPRIVIWNLAATVKDFHAAAIEEGVIQISGWSPSILKVLMTRGADALDSGAMLRAILDDERYAPVRRAVTPFFKQQAQQQSLPSLPDSDGEQ